MCVLLRKKIPNYDVDQHHFMMITLLFAGNFRVLNTARNDKDCVILTFTNFNLTLSLLSASSVDFLCVHYIFPTPLY